MEKEKNNATEIYVAQETETSGEAFDESNELDVMLEPETKEKQNIRVSEILELREGNRKVFRMSDGSNQAVFYPTNVHEFDEETNTFYDMDNTLNEEEDGRHFVNAKKHFVARFSKEEENDELFSLEKGTHRVTVFAKKNSKERNQGVRPEVFRKAADGIETTDAVVFAGVQSGSDYEYSVTSTGVKENIIVKEKADIYRFSFFIQQENVTAEFDESNKRISFISNETGEEVFFIPAPFMTDDNGIISTAVTYEVKNAANGNVVLNVLADSEWMNAEERAFPVVIDPQIQINGSYAMTTYSWLNGNLSAAALNTIGSTGASDGTRSIKRMYMNLKMPTLPLNPRIKKAELTFFQFSGSSTTTCDKFPKLGLYQVTDEISIGECTPAFDSNLID
ncbi:MAG: hypothetical protein E7387_07740, partial [Ruminococcaceae bacterium]|nr:hypothetical protein [Oscillospiraceae bacterium]